MSDRALKPASGLQPFEQVAPASGVRRAPLSYLPGLTTTHPGWRDVIIKSIANHQRFCGSDAAEVKACGEHREDVGGGFAETIFKGPEADLRIEHGKIQARFLQFSGEFT